MKKLIFLLFLISYSKIALSQKWVKTYESVDFIQKASPLSNGDIIAIASKQKTQTSPLDSILLLRIDKNGNLLKSFTWKVRIGRTLPFMVQIDTTIFFLLNSDSGKPVKITSFSLNLDSLNSKIIYSEPNKFFGARKMKKLSDGNILIAAQISDTAFLLKIDLNGSVINSQKFKISNSSSFGGINDFVEEDNGNITFICSGYGYKSNNYLFKLDKNLQVFKIIELNTEDVTELYKSTDNGFLLFYFGMFIRLDNNGNLISKNDVKELFKNFAISRGVYMNNDKFLLYGIEYDTFAPIRNILFQVNSIDKIDTLCSVRLPNRDINSQFKTPEGGSFYANNEVLFYGYSVDSSTNQQMGYIVKTDLNCTALSIKEIYNGSIVNIYPNPMSSQASISISEAFSNDVIKQIYLYDITGGVLVKDTFNGSTYFLNRNNLNSGLYIVSIIVGNEIIAYKKIIIE